MEHEDTWTQAFVEACRICGSWSAVPREQADSLKHYKLPGIREALWRGSFGKCAYCDSPVSLKEVEVEHFLPKPAYPQFSFDWDNFLPVCSPCNANKANEDVGKRPIVDPSIDDPESFFCYVGARIIPANHLSGEALEKARFSIDLLGLNRESLITSRSKHLEQLHFEDSKKRKASNEEAFTGMVRYYKSLK